MMLVPTSELYEGMVTAQDIRAHDNTLLIKRRTSLTATAIRLLELRRVSAVYIEQEGLEDVCPNDVVPAELRQYCQYALTQAMTTMQRQAHNARGVFINPSMIQDAVFHIVEEILASKNTLVAMMDVRDWDNRMFQHSVNTAVLSTIIANKMGYSEVDCKQLAIGMLFHDCGQMFLPREITEKNGKLTEDELKIMRQHARIGFKRILRGDVVSPLAAYIVLRHHERVDGTGYPDRLSGESLHPLARIAAVVEAFDAMTSLRSYGRPMMPDQAMRTILTQAGSAFDRDVALTLLRHVAIYPTGSAVRLNTGERGIVVKTPAGETTRPTVRLFFDEKGRRMPLLDVDLAKDRSRRVAVSGISLEQVKSRRHKAA